MKKTFKILVLFILSSSLLGCIGGEQENDVDGLIIPTKPSLGQPIEINATGNQTNQTDLPPNSQEDSSTHSDSTSQESLSSSEATFNAISERDVNYCSRITDADSRYKCIKKWCETKEVADYILCSTLKDLDDRLYCLNLCPRPKS
jgi:hypothetical protein